MLKVLFALPVLAILMGCGGLEEFPVAPVTGVVMCDGKPVSDVQVLFGPVGDGKKSQVGRSGRGVADKDGKFVVSTYGTDDGAVVGKHNVVVIPPHPEDFPLFHCDCETDGVKPVMEFDVSKGGKNEVTVNLPKKTSKSRPTIDAEDLADVQEGVKAKVESALEKAKQ